MYTSIEALQTLLKKPFTYDGIHIHSDDAFCWYWKLKNLSLQGTNTE